MFKSISNLNPFLSKPYILNSAAGYVIARDVRMLYLPIDRWYYNTRTLEWTPYKSCYFETAEEARNCFKNHKQKL